MAEKRRDVRLLLVTTGATDWCQQQRLLGSTDLPMSPSGLRAMRSAAEKLGTQQALNVVLSGPDEGSETTAQAFASANGTKVRTLDGLANPCLGLWEGLSTTDAAEKFAKAFKQWSGDPSSVLPPEGEAFSEAEDRILRTLSKAVLKLKGTGPVAVVLRPTASAIVRCWLESLPSSRVGWMAERTPVTEWRSVPRERFDAVVRALKTAS